MKTYEKARPEVELSTIKRLFPAYDETPLQGYYTAGGKIIKIITGSVPLQAILKAQGFTES